MTAPLAGRGGPGGASSWVSPAYTDGLPGGSGGVGSAGGIGGAPFARSQTASGGGGGASGRDCTGGVQVGYAGGAGSPFAMAAGSGGGGGGGGSGLFVSASGATVTVTGAQGGNGGAGGAGATTSGAAGSPGAGITVTGTGNTILASGTVAPGTGATTSDAVDFQGGNNILDLTSATVNGSVRMTAADSTLRGTGTGTISDSVLINAGTIAPGHSIGTINSVFLDIRGGTYNAEIDAAAVTADLFNVTGPSVAPGGSAWITGATVNISNLAGTPAVGQTFTLLTAAPGGVSGTFTLGTLPAGVSASLSYPGGTSVVLTITAVAAPVPAGPASIPTLSEWGLATLSLLVAGGILWQRRRGRV